jgi:hypothetical protein
MSFLKKYACMYGDLKFTSEEEAEIGRFCARLMKVANDDEALSRLFREEFGDVDESTFRRMNDYLEFIEVQEKEAQSPLAGTIGKIMAPLSLALAATPLIGGLAKSIAAGSAKKRAIAKIYQMHPELKSDPNVPMYYQAIADFAPEVAKNPLVAGNVIIQMHRVGPSWVTPQLIRELIGIQTAGEMGETKSKQMFAMQKPMIELARYYQTEEKGKK